MSGINHFTCHVNGLSVGVRFGQVKAVDSVIAAPSSPALVRVRFEGGASAEFAVADAQRLVRDFTSALARLKVMPDNISGSCWGVE